jgi:hypothetical protein
MAPTGSQSAACPGAASPYAPFKVEAWMRQPLQHPTLGCTDSAGREAVQAGREGPPAPMLWSAGARPGHWSCWVQGDLFSDDAQLPARVPTRRR